MVEGTLKRQPSPGLLGLAWTAITLLVVGGALALSAADAAAFTSSSYPVTVDGAATKGSEKITTEAGSIECTTSYHAELKSSSTTLALVPSYSECAAFGLAATVSGTGCSYLLHSTEEVSEDKHKATFDISCEAGKAILVTAGPCKMEIAGQAGLASIQLLNDTASIPPDITFKPEVSSISYKVTQDGFLCPFNGTGSKSDGSYTASAGTKLTGQSPSNPEAKIRINVGEPLQFTASSYPAALSGEGREGIATETGLIVCTASYQTELPAANMSVSMTPTYGNCGTYAGTWSISLNTNGCTYRIYSLGKLSEGKYKAAFDIVCGVGKAMKITYSPFCIAEIPPQSGLGIVELINKSGSIEYRLEVTGISYQVTEDGFLCFFNGTGPKTGGSFESVENAVLTDAGVAVDIG